MVLVSALRIASTRCETWSRNGEREPVACPLLDAERGVCRVYASRPIACRSYGFYAGHSHDAWCSKVAAHVAPVRDGLVFGNLDALERDLLQCGGARRDLLALLDL